VSVGDYNIHAVPTEMSPKFKSIKIQHNSTETHVILTTLISVYLMSTTHNVQQNIQPIVYEI